jgi:hypothetical protein
VAKSAYNYVVLHIAGQVVTGSAYDDDGDTIDSFTLGTSSQPAADAGTSEPPDAGVPMGPVPPPPGNMAGGANASGGCDYAAGIDSSAALGLVGLLLGFGLLLRVLHARAFTGAALAGAVTRGGRLLLLTIARPRGRRRGGRERDYK